MRPTLDALLDHCAGEGLHVLRAELPGDVDGAYLIRSRTILLADALEDWELPPTLAHEIRHHERQDDGPQARKIEEAIDEDVAGLFIDPMEYRWAEERCGWHTGGIAVELDVPMWVVRAYRRALEKAVAKASA
jgi:hypothetical protein